MKYLVRAVKYYLYLVIILALMIFVLMKLNLVNADIDTLFVNGRDSLWQIALLMAVFAAIYPRFGYTRRQLRMYGPYEELRPAVTGYMEARGYRLEKEDGENLSFVKRSPLARALKMFEDRVRFSRNLEGFELEGISKEVIAIAARLGDQN